MAVSVGARRRDRRTSWSSALAVAAAWIVVTLLAAGPGAAHPSDAGTSYQWVRPPHSRLIDNVAPEGRTFTLTEELLIQEFWSPDGQFHLSWDKGGIVAGDVVLDVQPLDPGELGPLEPPHTPNGNAYRLTLSPRSPLQGGILILRVPEPAVAVFHSRDGRQWRRLLDAGDGPGEAVVAVEEDGYFVAAAAHPPDAGTLPPVRVAVAATVAAMALVGWSFRHWARRRLAPEPG